MIPLLAYFRVHGILWLKQSYFSLKLCGNGYFLPVTVLTKFKKVFILKWDMCFWNQFVDFYGFGCHSFGIYCILKTQTDVEYTQMHVP